MGLLETWGLNRSSKNIGLNRSSGNMGLNGSFRNMGLNRFESRLVGSGSIWESVIFIFIYFFGVNMRKVKRVNKFFFPIRLVE